MEKKTCLNKDDKCNHLQPYSILQLFGKNNLTEKEKKEDTSKRRGSQLTGKELQKTAKINNRFLSKMKR